MPAASAEPIRVEPWPTERPLQLLTAVVSLGLWILAIVSIIGLVYALLIGLLFFVAHLTLIGHIRGNGVRLGPDQFPHVHEMVVRLSHRVGLRHPPEAYVIQGGGTLNAFATRFLSADIVVLYSNLLEACGDNSAACQMIVGHELAHVKRGHLRWHWFLLPSFLVPFLGTTLSRAREFTCDRYGMALADDPEGALFGLTILAAGGSHGKLVNREALMRQQTNLNTGFMRLAEWLSTHPPLAVRLAQLTPSSSAEPVNRTKGTLRGIAILGAMLLPAAAGGLTAATFLPRMVARRAETASHEDKYEPPPTDLATHQAQADFIRLSAFLQSELEAGRSLPADGTALYKRWNQVRRYEWEPFDPFDGERYGYQLQGPAFVFWSSGPDQESDTLDDIMFDSRTMTSSVRRGHPSPSVDNLP